MNAVSRLAFNLTNSVITHWYVSEAVWQYLLNTKDYVLEFKGSRFIRYMDSDWDGYKEPHRSTSGVFLKFGEAAL